MPCPVFGIALYQQPDRSDPSLTAIGNDKYVRTAFVRHRGVFAFPGGIEPHTHTAHQHIHRPVCRRRQIGGIDCAAVVQRRASALKNIVRSHDPKSPSRRQPLHLKHGICQRMGIRLPLLLIPCKIIPEVVIFSYGDHAVDHTYHGVGPVFLRAVGFDAAIGAVVDRLAKAPKAKTCLLFAKHSAIGFLQVKALFDDHVLSPVFLPYQAFMLIFSFP